MQLNISPKAGMIYYGVVAALGASLGCGTQFTTLFGAGEANKVIAGLSIAFIVLGAIGATLSAGASTEPGPLAPKDAVLPPPPNSAAKPATGIIAVSVAKALLVLLLVGGLLGGAGGGRALAASVSPLQAIGAFTDGDLGAAIALANKWNPPDTPFAACLTKARADLALIGTGLPLTAHLATDFERLWLARSLLLDLKSDNNCMSVCARPAQIAPILSRVTPTICDAINLAR